VVERRNHKIKKPEIFPALSNLLPDEDSNLDKQNQNLSYYHYTIGHLKRDAKISRNREVPKILNGSQLSAIRYQVEANEYLSVDQ
jgi:hypothetical protein